MDAEVRAIRPSEIDECLALWDTVWPEDGRAYFARYFYGDPDWQPEYTRVCIANGRIVSAAHIVKRIVSCGEFTLTMGGIANVATLPEYRRRGFSRACLQQCVEAMEADAMDFSLLFTGTHPLYEGLGWERVSTPQVTVKPKGSISVPRVTFPGTGSHISVREYTAADDDAIYRLYSDFNRSRPCTVVRTAPYWRDWIGLSGGSFHSRAIIAETDGSLCGYCLYRLDPGSQSGGILEIGMSPEIAGIAVTMLGHVAMDARSLSILNLRIPLHDDSNIALADRWLFSEPHQCDDDSAMIRFLHRDNLLRGLAPALTMRWLEAGGPAGSLTSKGPYGHSRIRSASGFLRVEEADIEEDSLNQADLFQLLIGRTQSVNISLAQDRFAEALFPRQSAWYWELDGF